MPHEEKYLFKEKLRQSDSNGSVYSDINIKQADEEYQININNKIELKMKLHEFINSFDSMVVKEK